MAPMNSAARRTASSDEAVFVITVSNMVCNCAETLTYSRVTGRDRAALSSCEVLESKGEASGVNTSRIEGLGEFW